MKSTGMVRKVDELGRITLPKELRRMLGIENGDSAEIFIDGDQIILKKYKPNMACAVTGEVSDDNLVLLGGKLVLSLNEAKKLVTEIESK
ncbi:AbrB/MazE/SpoVT family DNA-binding domain-containing protein [Lysinibacillus fusiformis]|uniref:Transcriptional pleiotropic regulator of transition state genes n=1 Tax=Lysinibacillus fusiformis TaxID=28031 RepID=A0A1H9GNI1_9BACI|nr:AbrB/MazE/SpoVT family DNA-binding domain-containing protein [Lysinibacillus fusiformis]SCY14331.1 transcriptional pleiotropic regulator of transition state genes [Lysinibacillus fusiformis]SEN31807.1 transcriptional pleiotropic regulator of transition state genes [Lysinibacillus fusiformis]SEQ51665.1 transcriptional pleiotropic regulator of transition state genes [Lysinibacillus fusiformis]